MGQVLGVLTEAASGRLMHLCGALRSSTTWLQSPERPSSDADDVVAEAPSHAGQAP
jgi:hypothetical protein